MEKIKMMSVSPEWAKYMLENKNNGNRRISNPCVQKYARDMKNNEWITTYSDPIVIDKNGELKNGQHRLSAVVLYGYPVMMAVVTNAEPSVMAVLDTGKSRTENDVVSLISDDAIVKSHQSRAFAKEIETYISNDSVHWIRKITPIESINLVMKYYELCKFQYHLLCKSTPLKICHASYIVAIESALINGVSEEDLISFHKICQKNEIPKGVTNKNVNAVLKFREWYLNANYLHVGGRSISNGSNKARIILDETKLAIYKYVNNVSRNPSKELYPITEESVLEYEKYLENKSKENTK